MSPIDETKLERRTGKETVNDPWEILKAFEAWLTADENNEVIGCEDEPGRETETD